MKPATPARVIAVVRVAVPSPLARLFDYLPRSGEPVPEPGTRVRVPFGRRQVVGLVLGRADASEVPECKLRPLITVLDAEPILPPDILNLLGWAAAYYHFPIGEVMATALPVRLRHGDPPTAADRTLFVLVEPAAPLPPNYFGRSTRQKGLFELLKQFPEGLGEDQLNSRLDHWRPVMKRLVARGLAVEQPIGRTDKNRSAPSMAPELTPAQARAVNAIADASGYACFLAHGVTGSGKTEIYLGAMARVVAAGGQVLVLVPEIGLTPQAVRRFEQRLGCPVAVLHSGLGDSERLSAWQNARTGRAPVVIGTRSAVFVPMPGLKLIVVDEEHDGSFKQQDGFRYHARDVAIKRASLEQVPIVLGSATPALESLHNAQAGRYRLLELPERAGPAVPPMVRVIDMRRQPRDEGLSPPLQLALRERLQRREQSLLFLNRRGYAPVLMCHDCGWLAPCHRCDARMTVHLGRRRLRCHHCGAEAPIPVHCPDCGGDRLHGIGEGTERVESVLAHAVPGARVDRIDRDSTRRKGSLERKLDRFARGEVDILVGTQMLAKGHDFPNLTLVGVLNADQGLFATDFRGEERLVQQLVQVTGRAGRADKPGEVMIQTWHPGHPVFASLVHHDYTEFARLALHERRQAGYPPFAHLALWRAESTTPSRAIEFLQDVRCQVGNDPAMIVHDPVPAPMERRAGRYRAQLLVQSSERGALHRAIDQALRSLDGSRKARQVRWSLDVDPVEMY